jgi:hypothetical protein
VARGVFIIFDRETVLTFIVFGLNLDIVIGRAKFILMILKNSVPP